MDECFGSGDGERADDDDVGDGLLLLFLLRCWWQRRRWTQAARTCQADYALYHRMGTLAPMYLTMGTSLHLSLMKQSLKPVEVCHIGPRHGVGWRDLGALDVNISTSTNEFEAIGACACHADTQRYARVNIVVLALFPDFPFFE
jgi:hypothetical protein